MIYPFSAVTVLSVTPCAIISLFHKIISYLLRIVTITMTSSSSNALFSLSVIAFFVKRLNISSLQLA